MQIKKLQDMVDVLRGKRKSIINNFFIHIKNQYTPTIISRVACLGNFTFDNIDFEGGGY